MISRIHSAILQGIDAIGCETEADVPHGGHGEMRNDGQHNIPVCGLTIPNGKTVHMGLSHDRRPYQTVSALFTKPSRQGRESMIIPST